MGPSVQLLAASRAASVAACIAIVGAATLPTTLGTPACTCGRGHAAFWFSLMWPAAPVLISLCLAAAISWYQARPAALALARGIVVMFAALGVLAAVIALDPVVALLSLAPVGAMGFGAVTDRALARFAVTCAISAALFAAYAAVLGTRPGPGVAAGLVAAWLLAVAAMFHARISKRDRISPRCTNAYVATR